MLGARSEDVNTHQDRVTVVREGGHIGHVGRIHHVNGTLVGGQREERGGRGVALGSYKARCIKYKTSAFG